MTLCNVELEDVEMVLDSHNLDNDPALVLQKYFPEEELEVEVDEDDESSLENAVLSKVEDVLKENGLVTGSKIFNGDYVADEDDDDDEEWDDDEDLDDDDEEWDDEESGWDDSEIDDGEDEDEEEWDDEDDDE